MKVRVAAVQMNSQDRKEENLQKAEAWIERAAAEGARLVALPEYVNVLGTDADRPREAEPIPGPTIARFQERAVRHGIYLHCGSIPETGPGGRVYNTTVVLNPDGEIIARYRKMHLYDVVIPGRVDARESSTVAPGDQVVTFDTEFGRMGLSICYDLRFPELYRRMAEAGARVIFVPAAFMLYTGKDHWEPLLRARAIENLAYVVAPAQFGIHPPSTQCFGNSLIADPWGSVIARAQEGEGLVVADLDFDFQDSVRAKLPALRHRHPVLGGAVGQE